MPFGDLSWESTLPPYLSNSDKNRLKDGLAQFFDPAHRQKTKQYDNFYLKEPPAFFMQGDIINSLLVYDWDFKNGTYFTGYAPVILVSNSCDVTLKESSLLEKEALFAPIIPLNEFFEDLRGDGYSEDNIASIHTNLKHQTFSNLFYLPPNPIDNREFVVFFDKIFWHPSERVQEKSCKIDEERFLSLDNFGFYLFICKISYHFCRVPEESERSSLFK